MQNSYLEIIHFLGETGYYARAEAERVLLSKLTRQGLIELKKGTKSVYRLTRDGEKHISRNKIPYTEYSDQEFVSFLQEAYQSLANPMQPLVRIPEIRDILSQKHITDQYFDKKLLSLHDEGVITLQTALSKSHAHGGISSNTGIFYYLTFEA
jgi:DNA-binding PadR family transcriptional regulator